ncbi:C4-dicarboxylate ABC transporter [Sporosarcina pasteurii]|uniref:C4-dicarboxylate ABC transporter n=1 Tax=Sporosarcina pasteurii TaxID=1474 RepID=A0A380CB97_SPOPA|nr:C4-dicarboxylate ABC transporter [Sporosarcina pasteurii]MDS9472711.1 hypothetical protein [Sporosarcina pasteurii]QBQ04366.1 C4-dicarboxylate ABC transporter [Sporosarcina pasteurii]SUJ15575.1 Uncharacterised protein [Sporosarcina pasteurii]
MIKHWGFWTGWLGIILAVLGFFFDPALGGVSIMLGLITFIFPKKMLASFSIGLGIIVLLLQHI